jgi:hypothetical protein
VKPEQRKPTVRILVAYDGSAFAKAAMFDLGRAGLSAETEACVLSVGDPHARREHYHTRRGGGATMLAHGLLVHSVLQDADAVAEEGTELLLARFPDWKV